MYNITKDILNTSIIDLFPSFPQEKKKSIYILIRMNLFIISLRKI